MKTAQKEHIGRVGRSTIMRIAPLILVATAGVLIAATCVTSFEGRWPTGPWTGEFQNNNTYDATFFEFQSTVTDATGRNAGPVDAWVCPSIVPAGGSAAFEFALAAEATGLTPPFTASAPEINAYTDRTGGLPEGLSVRTVQHNAGSATLEVRNDTTDRIFTEGTVCAVARSSGGNVVSVSREAAFRDLGPGETARVGVTFSSTSDSRETIEPHVQGVAVVLKQTNPDGSVVIDTGPFDVTLPAGWDYIPLQGNDSFVGEFHRDDVTIRFDYGWYSGNLDQYENDPKYTASHETIDGRKAVVVAPRGSRSGFTAASILVEEHRTSNTFIQTTILLQAEDVPNTLRAEVLGIYRSLRFESE